MPNQLRYRIEASVVRAIAYLTRHARESWWWGLGTILGTLAYPLMPRRRNIALSNLRRVYRERPEAELRAIVRESFRRLAWTFLELLAGVPRPESRPLSRVDVKGLEVLEKAQSEGRGMVIVTSHLGNWELLGAVVAQLGYKHLTLGKKLKNPLLNDWVGAERRSMGMDVAWNDRMATAELMERLERNEIVSLVTDQDARGRGVSINFLGVKASGHRGAAALALGTESPVVVATIVRQQDPRRHAIEFLLVPLPETMGSFEADVARLTQAYTSALSETILEHPADYLWAHNRFKNRMTTS